MEYWQHKERFEVTTDEFISMARRNYGYDVPTFRQALRDLFQSLTRTRKIEKEIPDLESAIEFLENREVLSVPKCNYPDRFTWDQYKQGRRWMMKEFGEVD